MGNNSTKEQRPPDPYASSSQAPGSRHPASDSSPSFPGPSTHPQPGDRFAPPSYSARNARPGRPDLGLLGIGAGGAGRDGPASTEGRKETKQEREARRAEKERVAREKERERSMREEGVDGGYLVTLGVYTGPEDFNKAVVRQLMIERRLAPFWRGLNDIPASWKEHQLIAAARGEPIPAADDIPPREPAEQQRSAPSNAQASEQNINSLTVPISSRSQSYNSDSSTNVSPSMPTFSLPSSSTSPTTMGPPSSSPFRPRSKTLASLTSLSKNSSNSDMKPREIQLPKDPYVDGQPIEKQLYKDVSECPICFLYYPPHLNQTRCCDQPICSECFVQIKRPDPHPPEHADPAVPGAGAEAPSQGPADDTLVSEPAACPFCVQPEFGITYESPAFRRGLAYPHATGSHPLARATSAMSSSTSVSSVTGSGAQSPIVGNRRRTTSISATAPSVITTDKIRPDWAQKLANSRAHAARRSAAATALHTAAYLMGGTGGDGRGLGGFRRRGAFMRGTGSGSESPAGSGSQTPRGEHRMTIGQISALSNMADRQSGNNQGRSDMSWLGNSRGAPEGTASGGSSGRSRVDDLEEMMMMEAIRLSLAAEEDRKKKEDKEAKKEAKKKDKESKKAEKAARKGNGPPGLEAFTASGGTSGSASANSSQAALGYNKGKDVDRPSPIEPPDSRPTVASGEPSPTFKMDISTPGDTSAESSATPEEYLHLSRARIQPVEGASATGPSRPSHLRQVSNTSSASSALDSPVGSLKGTPLEPGTPFDASRNNSEFNFNPGLASSETNLASTPAGGGAGTEPMFNFKSLAEMVGEEDKPDSMQVEYPAKTPAPTSEAPGGLPTLEEAVGAHEEGSSHQPSYLGEAAESGASTSASELGVKPGDAGGPKHTEGRCR